MKMIVSFFTKSEPSFHSSFFRLILLLYFLSPVKLVAQKPQTKQQILVGNISSGAEAQAWVKVMLYSLEKGKEGQLVTGGLSDTIGNFEFGPLYQGDYQLKIENPGYIPYLKNIKILAESLPGKAENDTFWIQIKLQPVETMGETVVITGTMKPTYISQSPIKVEVLSERFFRANPGNNIIEAMQTVNGVQEQVNCGVCGTNDIHINGMEGPYTLVLIDGMPIVSALSSVYGFNGIPSSLIKQVEIVKGPASSLYGTEAVGGVINIITKDPMQSPVISLNTFLSSHLEWNTDAAVTFSFREKVYSIFSANFYRNQFRLDHNKDNFTDIPLNSRLSLFNKWSVKRRDNRIFSVAARYYAEDRFGGEMQWRPENRGDTLVYGESIRTHRGELIGQYQLPIRDHDFRLDFSANIHSQNSFYGRTPFNALQSVIFSNFSWRRNVGKHELLAGLTSRYQTYDDNTPATELTNQTFIPGVFLQDEWKLHKKISLLGGFRLDYHRDHGFVPAPRLAIKYKPGDWTTFRLNAGRGFRLVNLFTEDHAALTGARKVIITENLKPEESWNLNFNANHVFTTSAGVGTLDFDAFYNWFSNKIIPDYTQDANLIVYENLQGYAIVRGASVSLEYSFQFPLKIYLGATFQDVYEVESASNGPKIKTNQLFTPKWSGTFRLAYSLSKIGLSFDYTGKVIGPQDLPAYDSPFSRPTRSTWYCIQNLQATKSFMNGRYEIYGGIKNLLGMTQASPLIDPAHPFGPDFDTAYAWGPLQPRRFYLGFRLSIKELKRGKND